MEGIIFDIKRFAIHDGPGIRTSVFFKGCPLKCNWCHNPESRKFGIENIESIQDCETVHLGYSIEDSDLMNLILKDRIYYEQSGGGVTFTGGEPTAQADFLAAMLELCVSHGIHTAVDTSGFVNSGSLRKIIPYTDLFLFDIKHLEDEVHKELTGVSNHLILKNLQLISELETEIHIRIPLIKGSNDSQKHITKLCEHIINLKNVTQIHVLPYHKTGQHKYQKFRIPGKMVNYEEPETEDIKSITSLIRSYDLDVIIGG